MTWGDRLPTVLVVVDDSDLRRRLVDHLRGTGFDVDACADAAEAQAAAVDHDAVVVDLRAGLMADVAVARQLGLRRPGAEIVLRTASLEGQHPSLPNITFAPTSGTFAELTAILRRTWRHRAQLLPV